MGDQLLVHLLELDSDKTEAVTVNIKEFVCSEDYTDFEKCVTNTDKLNKIIKKNILVNILVPSKTEEGNSTRGHSETNQGQRQAVARPPENGDPLKIPSWRTHAVHQPFYMPSCQIGDSDRMPFHSGSGGMVMDPFQRHGRHGRMPHRDPQLPRGAVPPGARFDQFRPPTVWPGPGMHPSGPDYDHMRPPGFDDMYM